MVLGDFFKNLFSNRKQPSADERDKDVGVTGLPRNIESDFLKQRENRLNEPMGHESWLGTWNPPQQQYEFVIGSGNGENHDETDFFHMSHHMFHQLDEMMKQMFSGFGRFGVEESFPNAGNYDGFSEHEGDYDSRSLRDKMLEDPRDGDFQAFKGFQIPSIYNDGSESMDPRSMTDWSWTFPFGNNRERPILKEHKDQDFDNDIKSGKSNLNDILDREDSVQQQKYPAHNYSFGSFSSVITKKRADGIIESQKTVKDSQGNEEITVIRKIGDQTHKKTMIKDIDGNEETKEDLLNMNEGDLEEFEQAWSKSEIKDESIPPAMWDRNFGKGDVFSGSLYDSIRDLFLPWNRKE